MASTAVIEHDGAKLVFETGVYTRNRKKKIVLTRREVQVLALLMRKPGRWISHETISEKIFKNVESLGPGVYIHYLRKKGIGVQNKTKTGYRYCGICQKCRERRHR